MDRNHKYKAYINNPIHGTGVFKVKSINFFPLVVTVIIPNGTYIDGIELTDEVQFFEGEVKLLEYTGLKDRIVRKDGSSSKEIYRCDVIKALNRNYDCEDNKKDYFQLFEVTYLNGCYMFGNWNAHEFFNKFIYIKDLGSKFENTDLLESDNNE
jgi:hypothetical protein